MSPPPTIDLDCLGLDRGGQLLLNRALAPLAPCDRREVRARSRHDVQVRTHDVAVGKHGDHVGGERDAARALMAGEVDAACMIDGNHFLFTAEGTLPPGATRVLTQTQLFDHCNFTALSSAPRELVGRFKALLLAMSYDDPAVRPLLDMEGLKQWRGGRTSGYGPLEGAVADQGFYDGEGHITAAGYRP
ncbi:MAG: PhnD/SsuA/transferrin family substrate-binding protein [Acidimicrobiales bacterium]